MSKAAQPNPSTLFDSYLENVKLDLAKKFSLLLTFVFTLLTLVHMHEDIENFVIMSFGLALCLFCFIYVHITGKYKIVYYTFSVAGVCVSSISLNMLPSATHFGDFIWMFCAVVLAFFGINNRLGFLLLFICSISIALFVLFNVNENIVTQQPRTNFQKFSLLTELIFGFYLGLYMIYLIVKFYNHSEKTLKATNNQLKLQYDKIKVQDEEKTILVKEIHHRVKNNLQIVSSLLRMQSNELESEESKQHFQEAIDRILAMSMIHQKLYQGESLAKVNLTEYFEDLILELIRLYDNKIKISRNIIIKVDKIGLKSIVPLGLLVNELVSNSLKHAFKNREDGNIELSFLKNNDGIILHYGDNGIWSDKNLNKKSGGFGLELIDILIEQLEGDSSISKEKKGTSYRITFPELDE